VPPGRPLLVNTGRDDKIWTCDPLLPKQWCSPRSLDATRLRYMSYKSQLSRGEIVNVFSQESKSLLFYNSLLKHKTLIRNGDGNVIEGGYLDGVSTIPWSNRPKAGQETTRRMRLPRFSYRFSFLGVSHNLRFNKKEKRPDYSEDFIIHRQFDLYRFICLDQNFPHPICSRVGLSRRRKTA